MIGSIINGITFEHRVDSRMKEHAKDGKVFDKVIVDKPKPRSTALELEKKRIKLHKPNYNIHHNS